MTGTPPPLKLYPISEFFGPCSKGVLVVQSFVSFVDSFLFLYENVKYSILPYYSEFYDNVVKYWFYT